MSESDHNTNIIVEGGRRVDLTPVELTDAQWRERLTPEQYRILRQAGTERAFTGEFWDTSPEGLYVCAGCGAPLFVSDDKFISSCGWPAFSSPYVRPVIREIEDRSHGMVRTEVRCAKCDSHLGHVFEDGPPPTGIRYCINSVSIRHIPHPGEGVDRIAR